MKRSGFLSLAVFLGLNFTLSLVLGLGFFMFADRHPVGLIFSAAAYLSNTLMIYAALLAASLLPYFAYAGAAVFVPLFASLQMILVLDFIIYKIFRFHMNSMVVNLLFTPGGFQTLGLGPVERTIFFVMLGALLAVELWFYRLAGRKKAPAAFLAGHWKTLLAASLLIAALDKGMCAWGRIHDNVHITGNSRLFPLYQPLNMDAFAGEYLGAKLDEEVKVDIGGKYSRLDYPKNPLDYAPPGKPLNILIIVVDSFRADVLNAEVTPDLWAFSKKASVFENHYSGGNCTRFGIFSIMYGLYGNYWFPMLGERRGPVLIDALKERGYDLRLYASAELSFPEFNKTCFVSVPRENIYDRPEGKGQVAKDIEITGKFREFVKNRKGGKPYFAFIFYDASHGGYEHPPDSDKFRPESGEVNYFKLDPGASQPLFNKYRNSIRFEDSLTGEILADLERSGGLKDTAVLVMGDHGEAFFERGYHGHNRGYGPEEIRVPLVFYVPGRPAARIKYPTSHMDIAPALMKLAGVRNPPGDYASGMDIFHPEKRPFITAFSWDTAAILRDGYALVMPLEAYRGGVTLYDPAYQALSGRKALEPFMPYLSGFQKEARKFYK
jgi:hypothetical protein